MADLTYTTGTDSEYADSFFGNGLTVNSATTIGTSDQIREFGDGDINSPDFTPSNTGLIFSTGNAI